MSSALRIAVVDRQQVGLTTLMGEVPGNARLRSFADVIGDADALRAWHPDVLLLNCPEGLPEALVGALQVLRVLLPQVHMVVGVAAEVELASSPAATALNAQLLALPTTRAALLEALIPPAPSTARDGSTADIMALVRGLSDEINNPLLFASGHLQLLESLCEAEDDIDKLDQVRAIRRGMQRISQTMDKIRVMSRARALLTPLPQVPIAELMRTVIDQLPEVTRQIIVPRLPADLPAAEVACDLGLLSQALCRFFEVAGELLRLAEDLQIVIAAERTEWNVAVELHGLGMEDWQLPHTFAPYHLRNAMRGTVHGLNLFLVQRVVHAHGGLAAAQRVGRSGVRLQVSLPVR